MDSVKISANPEVLRERAKAFANYGQQILNVKEDIDRIADNLEAQWEGEACEAYIDLLDRYLPKVSDVSVLTEKLSKQLVSIANAIEEADNKTATGYSGN